MKKILVIIPNYNKLILLKECLLHLENQDFASFDTMIVDNGSDDGSAEYIHKLSTYSDNYKACLLDKNMGFAFAVNSGIKYAIANDYEYSILLNNDAYVEEGFVRNLYHSIEKDKKLFAVSSMMINFHKNKLIDSFGDNYNILNYAFQNRIGEKVDDIYEDEYCFSACAGASIYRNSVFREIGLFDEKFFAYLEDVDISYRAKLHGYSIKTCRAARCFHLGSATSGSKYNEFKVKISARNSIYLLYKNMPLIQIIVNIIPLFWGIVIKQIFFITRGFGLDYFFGIFEGFKSLPTIDRHDTKNVSPFIYIFIEIEIFINLFKYAINFAKRHLDEK